MFLKDSHVVRRLGRDSLKTQPPVSLVDVEIEHANENEMGLKTSAAKIKQLELALKINISEDLPIDWSIAGWDSFMIEAACEYLVLQSSVSEDTLVLTRALEMMERLLKNSWIAIRFFRSNIGGIISHACCKRIRSDRRVCRLQYLRIIRLLQVELQVELSENSFILKFSERLMIELNLAAGIIQHFMSRFKYKKYNEIYEEGKLGYNAVDLQRGKLYINAQYRLRSRFLRDQWRELHTGYTHSLDSAVLPHMSFEEVCVGCEIIASLVCFDSAPAELVRENHLELLRSNVLLLLRKFYLSGANDTLSSFTSNILLSLSHSKESLLPMLQHGCFESCLKIILSRSSVHSSALVTQAMNTIYNLSLQCFKLPKRNLFKTSQRLESRPLVSTLVEMIMLSSCLSFVRCASRCLLSVTCLGSAGYRLVIEEIGRSGGRCVFRLVELIDEHDTEIAPLAVALFLQISRQEAGRCCLLSSGLTTALMPFVSYPHYSNISYQYAILLLANILCAGDAPPFDPVYLSNTLADLQSSSALISEILLRCILGINTADKDFKFNLQKALIDSHVHERNSNYMTRTASTLTILLPLLDYFTNPVNVDYYRSLAALDRCSRAIIIQNLIKLPSCAKQACSEATFRFLSHCVYYSSYLFHGKWNSAENSELVLLTAENACAGLSSLCRVVAVVESPEKDAPAVLLLAILNEVNVIEAVCFFMKTLGVMHIGLDEQLKLRQESTAVAALNFLCEYLFLVAKLKRSCGKHLFDMTNADLAVQSTITVMPILLLLFRSKYYDSYRR